MSTGRGFVPDNTQQAARFSVPPIRKVEIRLDNANRANGEFLSAFEGDFLYVDQTDFPCLLSLVTPSTQIGTAIVARAGTEIHGPFKGIFLTHPFFGTAVPMSLRLLLGQKGSSLSNEASLTAFHAAGAPQLAQSSTAVLYQALIPIPFGSRVLVGLEALMASATTLTSAQIGILDANAAALTAPPYTDDQGRVFTSVQLISALDVAPVGTTQRARLGVGIALPTFARYVQITLVGTGFAGTPFINALWQ